MTQRDTTARGTGNGTRYDTGPTVVVITPEGVGSWNGGVFAGDRAVVRAAEANARIGAFAVLRNVTIVAGKDTPAGALAAMVADYPGRFRVEQAPEDVLELIGSGTCSAEVAA